MLQWFLQTADRRADHQQRRDIRGMKLLHGEAVYHLSNAFPSLTRYTAARVKAKATYMNERWFKTRDELNTLRGQGETTARFDNIKGM